MTGTCNGVVQSGVDVGRCVTDSGTTHHLRDIAQIVSGIEHHTAKNNPDICIVGLLAAVGEVVKYELLRERTHAKRIVVTVQAIRKVFVITFVQFHIANDLILILVVFHPAMRSLLALILVS
jgi:hypothetical protein